ncbi:MAG: PAS domain S-box protein [Methanoregula sp.]
MKIRKHDGSFFDARLDCIRMKRTNVNPVVRLAISDITEQKRAEERLKIFKTFTENARDIVLFIRKSDGRIIEANQKASEVYGFSHDMLLGMTLFNLRASDPRSKVEQQIRKADAKGVLFEALHRKKDGQDLPVEINSFSMNLDGEPVLFSIIRDITDRKRAEAFRQLSADVLGVLNEPTDVQDILRRVLNLLKQATQADCIGIRLRTGDDFPYFVHDGFSTEFLLKENTLAPVEDDKICRDENGDINLECTCGLVISGKTDPNNPLFTPGGSFWTNNSSSLLELPESDDPRYHPRNTCIHMGFASVAIIPIRKNVQQIIGTLQINCFRKDGFTLDIIQSLELIGGQIAEAMMRKRAEDRYRTLFENMMEGFAYCRMLYNKQGHPVDFIYLAVNPAFYQIIGVPVVIGRPVTEVFPGIKQTFPELFEIYGRVAETGVSESFDINFRPVNKWLHISVSSQAKEHFMALFSDITTRKLAEEDLIRRSHEIETANEELTVTGEELRENEAKLTTSLEEKEVLLAEIHHRVKNNLASFISLLSLEGSYEDSAEGKRLKRDLQNRARSMALIHETVYKTRNFSSVDMGIYLSTLIEQIGATYRSDKNIHTIVNAEGVSLDLNRSTPCGLIVNELITNAFKYAFPKSFDCKSTREKMCTIWVTFILEDGYYTLTVRDNGIGLPETFDPKTAKSLGLKLVNFLARHQLRAEVNVSGKEGAAFSIRFREIIGK